MSRQQPLPRTPVLVVSCPQCGGSVRDTELGERTKCAYCGTDLHLPTVDYDAPCTHHAEPADEPIEEAPISVVRQEHDLVPVFAVLVGSVAAFAFLSLVVGGKSEPAPAAPRVVVTTPRVDTSSILANSKCVSKCNEPCLRDRNVDALLACTERCRQKCDTEVPARW